MLKLMLELMVGVNASACNSFDNDSDSDSLVEIAELQTPVIGDDFVDVCNDVGVNYDVLLM